MKIWAIIFLFYLLGVKARAQNLTDTIPISEVEVRASIRIVPPGIIKTTVDTTFIIENQFSTITEILHNYTPVFVKTYGNGGLATISFRGTHASHTKVQWNDMEINSPMLGQVDFSNIPVFFFDEMELYHGNSSLLNGSGGLGGSIMLGTKPDWGKKFSASLINQAGSYGTYNTGLKAGGGNHKTQVRTRLFYGNSRNDFEYFNNSVPDGGWEENKNASFQSLQLMQEVYRIVGSRHQVSIAAWGGMNTRNVPPLMNYGGIYRKEQLKNRDLKATAIWIYYKSVNSLWKLSSGYNYNDLRYFLGDSVNNILLTDAFDTISNSGSTTHTVQNKLEWERTNSKVGDIQVSLYQQYENADTYDDAPLNKSGYDAHRNKLGIMLNVEKSFTSTVSGFVVLRQEWVDKGFLPPSPLLGLQYMGKSSWEPGIKISVAANHNIPSLNALYWIPWGNTDLKTEKGYSGDLGMSISRQKGNAQLQSTINLFAAYMYDWIMWVPGKSAQNVQEVFSRGMETNIRVKQPIGPIDCFLSLNYSFTHTTSEKSAGVNDNSKGNQLIYIPLHKTGTYMKCEMKGYYMKHTFTYTDKRFGSLDNDILNALPAYYLHDIMIGREWFGKHAGLDVSAGIQNLFNQDYQSVLYRAMPGRHYTLSLILNFSK